jgi:hypothetical protein
MKNPEVLKRSNAATSFDLSSRMNFIRGTFVSSKRRVSANLSTAQRITRTENLVKSATRIIRQHKQRSSRVMPASRTIVQPKDTTAAAREAAAAAARVPAACGPTKIPRPFQSDQRNSNQGGTRPEQTTFPFSSSYASGTLANGKFSFVQSWLSGPSHKLEKDGISFDHLLLYMQEDSQANALVSAVEHCSRKLLYCGINRPLHHPSSQ